MIRYKIDVMQELRKKGISTYVIRRDKLLGQSYITQINTGEMVSWATIDKLCSLLECQVGDICQFVPDGDPHQIQSGIREEIQPVAQGQLDNAEDKEVPVSQRMMQIMHDDRITYASVADKIGMSTAGVYRALKNGNLTESAMHSIAEAIGYKVRIHLQKSSGQK